MQEESLSGPSLSDTAEPSIQREHWLPPWSVYAGMAVLAGAGLASFAAQWVSVMLWVPPERLSAIWIPGGVMLAIALLTEPRRWPAVIGAAAAGSSLLFAALDVLPLPAAMLLGLLAGVQTVAVATMLRGALHGPLALDTLQEFLVYCGTIVLGAFLASTLFLFGAWSTGFRPATFLFWRTFALSVLLAYLSVTPTIVLIAGKRDPLRRGAPGGRIEAGLLGLLLALACGLVFSSQINRSLTWTGFAMTLPPLLLWAAVRCGTLGASAALLLVSVISTFSASHGLGPFAEESAGENLLSLQLFILGTGVPLLGLAVVLSEQRRTQSALEDSHARLRGLNRELLTAREAEGTRIARELHDDVGQRLALVSIGLGRLRQQVGAQTDAHARLGTVADILRLQEQASSIGRTLREISHQLHPAALEQVGLSAALRLQCEEVREATGLAVHMVNHGDTATVPADAALCVYRVAQEALTNVIRHSGANRVDLLLRRDDHRLVLEVTDDGCGVTPGPGVAAHGLGLRSAAERADAVGGALTLESSPGAGTTVRMTVPFGLLLDA